jgi:hypothetical protein
MTAPQYIRDWGIRLWKSSTLLVLVLDCTSRSSVFCFVLMCPSFFVIDAGVATIPSQSAVLAAKEKRERMRAAGPSSSHADEYISLSLTTRVGEYQGPHPESRLMREDDDLGEGDDGELSNQPYSQ